MLLKQTFKKRKLEQHRQEQVVQTKTIVINNKEH